MAEKNRYFIVSRNNWKDSSSQTLMEVSEEIYRELDRETSRIRKQLQSTGQCTCTLKEMWVCDLDCLVCKHRAFGNQVSLDEPTKDSDGLTRADSIADDVQPLENTVCDKVDLENFLQKLDLIDPEWSLICKLRMEYSERETAEIMGLSRSSFKRRQEKIRKYIHDHFADLLD